MAMNYLCVCVCVCPKKEIAIIISYSLEGIKKNHEEMICPTFTDTWNWN